MAAQTPLPRTGPDWAAWLHAAAQPPSTGMPRGAAQAEAWDRLTWLARRAGFAVEREHCGHGDGVPCGTAG